MAARTLKKRLLYRLVPAAGNAAMVGLAMLDHSLGVGVLIGIGASAIVSAVRDHRRDKKIAAEAAVLDQKLDVALAEFRRRGICFDPPAASEEHFS
ncbi:MAG TPA: hypothetical protein VLE97_08900 [Gaiellaceae bacterium]|nr:hypothetical protein [Gaiellaceae bacterium]